MSGTTREQDAHLGMKVLAERDSSTYDATEVEDGPEDANE